MFKRGRYVSRLSLDVDETPEGKEKAKRERQERERFSVAAIAFCIKHNDEFKRHFLNVFGKPPQQKIQVTLEPEHCADLVLEGDGYVLVLEFKIDAPLEPHQNPEKPAFWNADGYGAKICENFAQARKDLRYVVIGKEVEKCNRDGLECSSVPWRNLLICDRPENNLEEDLYDCLGHLGAPGFLHRHMKNLELAASKAKQGMAVYGFLDHVLSQEGLSSGVAASDGKTLGLNIKKAGGGGFRRKLIEAVQPTGQSIGWIGYSTWDTEFAHLAVGFYCSQKAAESKLRKRLEAAKDLGEVANDGLHIYFDLKRDGSTDDAEWFKKVLKIAAGS